MGKDADHPIFQCKIFPTNSDKLKELEKLNGCKKCSYLNHNDSTCNRQFKTKCQKCSDGLHYSFLCPAADNKNTSTPESHDPKASQVKTVVVRQPEVVQE